MEYNVESLGPVVTLVDDVIGFVTPQNPISEELLRPDPDAAWNRYDEELFESLTNKPLVPKRSETSGHETLLSESTFDDLISDYTAKCDSEFPQVEKDFDIDFNWFYYRIDEVPPSLYTSDEVAAILESKIDKKSLVPPPPLYYDPQLYSIQNYAIESQAISDSGSTYPIGSWERRWNDERDDQEEERTVYRDLDWFTDAAYEHIEPLQGPSFHKEALVPTQALLRLKEETLAEWLERSELDLKRTSAKKRLLLLKLLLIRAQRSHEAEYAYQDWCERKDVLSTEEKMQARDTARRIGRVFYSCVNPDTKRHERHPRYQGSAQSQVSSSDVRMRIPFEQWLGGALERLRLSRRKRYVERQVKLGQLDHELARKGLEVETQILSWRNGIDATRVERRQRATLQDKCDRLLSLSQGYGENGNKEFHNTNQQSSQRQIAAVKRAHEDRVKARASNLRRINSLIDMTGVSKEGVLKTDVRRIVSEMKPEDIKYIRWLWNSREISGTRREGLKLLLDEAEEVEAIQNGTISVGWVHPKERASTRHDATIKRLAHSGPVRQPMIWK